MCLSLLAFLVFLPALGFGWIELDDPAYVFENPFVQQGLTATGVRWAFESAHEHYWIPLTWISFMLDRTLFGPGPSGYHATNVLLHAVNTALLYLLLVRMTGRRGPSAVVAALFALHPLRVEAVAWITSRKDVLSSLFWLLGLHAYVSFADGRGRRSYAAAMCGMALALMSKAMPVTFPLLLLVLDFWPLRRMARGAWPRLLAEKIPFLLLTVAFAGITVWTRIASSDDPASPASWLFRAGRAAVHYVEYLRLSFWPAGLSIRYPPPAHIPVVAAAASAAILLAVTAVAAWQAGRRPWLLAGWLWFAGTLVPVIGLIPFGDTGVADRFTYMPHIGLWMMVAWSFARAPVAAGGRAMAGRGQTPEWGQVIGGGIPWRAGLAVAAVSAYAAATVLALRPWRDGETLLRRALAVTRDNWTVENALGRTFERRGDVPAAVGRYREAIRIAPGIAELHANLGTALVRMGKADEALEALERAAALKPGDPRIVANHGAVLFQAGHRERGLGRLREAVRLDDRLPDIHFNLALALLQTGADGEALDELGKTIRLNPADDRALFVEGRIHAQQGDWEKARDRFAACFRLRPSESAYRQALDEARRRAQSF